ncbi:MAG: BCD family MFS transporter [Anaerolineae bacterium]|nr:BCD family MFS transporter [Anaerolineae bacterium]
MSTASVSVAPSKAAAVSDRVSLLTIMRLTMPKLGVSYLFTLLLSVFNRVMINELAIAAGLIGGLYFLYRSMNIFQVWAGRYADRRVILGLRRTPMMFLGVMLAALALVPLPHVAVYYSETRSVLGIVAMAACLALFGLGFAMNGDAHNTLIAEQTEGKRNRPAVVATVWLFQIVFIVISGIVSSIVLQIADTQAGAPPGCTTAECAAIRSAVAVRMMPYFFLMGPVLALIGFLPVLGVEARVSETELARAAQKPQLNVREAYARIFTNPQARVFFFFIVTSIFALFLQDNILEPFGADVFKLAPRQTAQFQPIMGMGTILAMLVMGIVASKYPIPKRTIADWGLMISAAAFALLTLSALTHALPLLFAGIAILGIGMGVFNVGALSMMMDMTVPGEAGSLMGAWGMAQALSNGFAQFVGGALRDLGIQLTGSFEAAYSVIFVVAIGMSLIAINLMARVNVELFRKLTREQLVATMEAA